MDLLQQKTLFMEIFRYLIVGGSSFIVDFGTLCIFKEFILPDWNGYGVLVATAIGFVAGLIFNYIFSLLFVFNAAIEEHKGKTAKDFLIFTIVGIIGLILTELGMYVGVNLMGIYYMLVKIVVTVIVLFWNYIGRKVLIFR